MVTHRTWKCQTKCQLFNVVDPQPVAEIAPDPALHWEPVKLGEGAKGPTICCFTRLRVIEHRGGQPFGELWLLLRKNIDGEIRALLSNAPLDISFEELLRVSQMRWTIEQLFQEGKDFLGLDEYELRSYPGWHRHMALINVTMHFLLTIRLEFGLKKLYHLADRPKISRRRHDQGPL